MRQRLAVFLLYLISVAIALIGFVGCGENSQLGISAASKTSVVSTATIIPTHSSSTGTIVAPQPVRTDISQWDIPEPVETKIALATHFVVMDATAIRSASETAVAVATMQAYLRLTPTLPPRKLVGQGDFGTWSYEAYIYTMDDGYGAITKTLIAAIKYDYSTVESMFAYAKANQDLADQLAAKGGKAEIHITFRNYVEPNQFRSWVKANGLQVKESMLRLTDPNPEYAPDVGADVRAGDSDPLPQDSIAGLLRPMHRLLGKVIAPNIMRGVCCTVGTIDAKQLPKVVADPLVFVADVTINVVRDELKKAGVPGAENAYDGEGIPPPFFWDMEHKFGLDKFKK